MMTKDWLSRISRLGGCALMFALLTGCQPSSDVKPLTQSGLKEIADNLRVGYQVVNNIDVQDCNPNIADGKCYLAEYRLTFAQDIVSTDWQLYLSHISPIQWSSSQDFEIEHLNGDLHRIKPLVSLKANHEYILPFKAAFWSVSESDLMPNFFMVAGSLSPEIVASTREQFDADSGLPYLPHHLGFKQEKQLRRSTKDNEPIAYPAQMYQQNLLRASSSESPGADPHRVIPKLANKTLQGEISLADGIKLNVDKPWLDAATTILQQYGLEQTATGAPVQVRIDNQQHINNDAYQLSIEEGAINISAKTPSGAFYALMTLGYLFNEHDNSLPVGEINDVPAYRFRGLHLDVARNFHSKAMVLRLIQNMARFKLNKLHFHLADDEGWRLAIRDLPELTAIGGFRCYDPGEQRCLLPQLGSGPFKDASINGYYSREDYIEILKVAKAHQIEVIPSLDMPGHARAAIVAMQARYHRLMAEEKPTQAKQYLLNDFDDPTRYSSVQHYSDNTINPCQASSYRFVGKVLDELIAMHNAADAPLKRYHIGADETAGAWKDSPVCQSFLADNSDGVSDVAHLSGYFIERVAKMVTSKGVLPGAWSDGATEVLQKSDTPRLQVNVWDTLFWGANNAANSFANADQATVLSIPDALYFDFPYQADPQEPGYYWASRATDSYKVFQFMPENLANHWKIWPDRMGQPYEADIQETRGPNKQFEGIQGQLWSETVRSDEMAEYLLYPRLIALAERAWHRASWAEMDNDKRWPSETYQTELAEDWHQFAHSLVDNALPAIERSGSFYRLPLPGADVVTGELRANSPFPGLIIEYRSEQGEWKHYLQPVPVSGKIALRTKLPDSTRVSRAIIIE